MSNEEKLNEIAQQIEKCQKCSLYKTANKSVPGGPNPNAQIVFIGEAPGYWEDQKGIPFCGAAGNLLDKLLAEINLKREDIFIGNILKHRPPDNRDPLPEEITACTPFLKQQLLIMKPKIIVTLGRFAMNYFIPNVYISHTHGQAKRISWEQLILTIFPVYHPAAALRNGNMMNNLREDFAKIPQIIEQIEEIENQPVPKPEPKQESLF